MIREWLLPALVLVPAIFSGLGPLMPSARAALRLCLVGTCTTAAVGAWVVLRVVADGTVFGAGRWLMVDALSAYHVFVMMTVFCLGAAYSATYFGKEIDGGAFSIRDGRRFASLWFGSLASMILVLVSNNLGVMWVGIEATTLATAFLICIHANPRALEAMWKYLLMCSVGVALAFTGTLLVAAAAQNTGLPMIDRLLWTALMENASRLDVLFLKAGFIFMVIGYGTKAGLAPMHNWLPDAHSQAPAPVSAIFSGFLLNAALYCILRCSPIVKAGIGDASWSGSILVVFGIASVLIAAVFIMAQHDLKRLLAYHSVEHMGIIALGMGLGGIGTVAALFHTFNHSLCKTLSFFCAGSLGQNCGTHDMRKLTDVIRINRAWGLGLIGSLLALIGVAPFALFLSELLILKAAVDAGAYWKGALFLVGIGIVFVGAARHVISMAWQPSSSEARAFASSRFESVLVAIPLAVLVMLCVFVPAPFWQALNAAARIVGGAV